MKYGTISIEQFARTIIKELIPSERRKIFLHGGNSDFLRLLTEEVRTRGEYNEGEVRFAVNNGREIIGFEEYLSISVDSFVNLETQRESLEYRRANQLVGILAADIFTRYLERWGDLQKVVLYGGDLTDRLEIFANLDAELDRRFDIKGFVRPLLATQEDYPNDNNVYPINLNLRIVPLTSEEIKQRRLFQ